ncbi:MAG TPA: SMC-Scp complex subunit ScpB [Pyrinomonadaceae bacterium]|nr:SMC-Scp complex subunit ScpB [Pyrinomonadaceae bacterium]
MSREEEDRENESAADAFGADGDAELADAVSDDAEAAGDAESSSADEGARSLASVDDADGFEEDDAGAGDEEDEVVIHDADAEDAAEKLAAMRREMAEKAESGESVEADDIAPGGSRSMAELISIIESLIFVSDEPLPAKTLAEVLKEDRGWVEVAVEELAKEFNERNGGLMLREVAGGWQFATRPENHEHVRAFLKSRPSAKLSLAALETLAVIAYKQPITVPEILEIRGVQSSSAIKTLLDKRLIVSKGRKETVGRPMMYGTSKEFLLQFGLRDLSELPNVEDFEDLATGGA